MHTILCSTHFLFLIIIFVCVDSQLLPRHDDENFRNCGVPFECGPTILSYPFWGNGRNQDCGRPGFQLKCQDSYTMIETKSVKYRVLKINQDNRIITIARMDIFSDDCPETFVNDPLGGYAPDNLLTFLFNCSQSPSPISYNFTCLKYNFTSEGFYAEESARSDLFQSCNKRILVSFRKDSLEDLQQGLPMEKWFKLEYKEEPEVSFCNKTHGQCGYDWSTEKPICFYPKTKSDMPAFFLNFISSSSI